MSDVRLIEQGELELMKKAAVYLRDKLLSADRDGPLVKLLHREIEVYNDELSRRARARQNGHAAAKHTVKD